MLRRQRYREANTAQELLDTLAELKETSAGVTVVEAHSNHWADWETGC